MGTRGSKHSPDAGARGLLPNAPDAARYGGHSIEESQGDPFEVPGILRSWMPEGVRVLDVGCGTGVATLYVQGGKSNDVLCVEPDEIRANIAASLGLNVVQGFLDDAMLAGRGTFDVVVFSDVLEHVPAPAEVLELAARALSPGGCVIASVPNVAHWTVRLKLLFGRFEYTSVGIMDATHLRWFTRKTLRSLFEAEGFKVVEMASSAGNWMGEYGHFPFNLFPDRARRRFIAWLARMSPQLFGCQHLIRAEVVRMT